jgi:hypothetical protein
MFEIAVWAGLATAFILMPPCLDTRSLLTKTELQVWKECNQVMDGTYQPPEE